MHLSLVVFDLDGTLIDSAGGIHQAVNCMLAEYGCTALSLSAVRGMIGEGAVRLVSRVLAASGLRSIDHAAALRRFMAHYSADPTVHTQVYPGAMSVLELLRTRRVPVALLTHKAARLTDVTLSRLGFDGYFTRVVGGDSLPFHKPDPRALLEILRGTGATPEQTLMVGDSEIDAATAHAAQVPFALMTHGYHRGPPDQIPSLARFDHFDALRSFIERN